MKSIGQQVQEFRIAKRWNTSQLAREIGTSRQNIEHLEARGDITPKYIAKLAEVMGLTVDSLIAGKYSAHEMLVFEEASNRLLPPRLTKAPPPQSTQAAVAHFVAAVAESPNRGSDALIGLLTSVAKDPANPIYSEMLVKLLSPVSIPMSSVQETNNKTADKPLGAPIAPEHLQSLQELSHEAEQLHAHRNSPQRRRSSGE